MMVPKAIQLESVDAGYGTRKILHNINLNIDQGDMVGVLGPNGAGKSTLLKVITGLIRAMSGEVCLGGEVLHGMSAQQRASEVAVVPQTVETPMAYTVEEMVHIGRTVRLGRFGRAGPGDELAIERAMAYTDVIDLRSRSFSELSGGEGQRAVVAMALAQESRCILLDEATSHLDMNHRLEVLEIIERLNRDEGKTVLMVSHDLNLVAEFCRRIVLMDRGRIVADGSPRDVLTEDVLSRTYNCPIRVHSDVDNGGLTVAPARRIARSAVGAGKRIHVVAGGGSGETLMRRLVLSGFKVSCGVLNRGDSDAQTAAGLGVECVLERPFSSLSKQAVEEAALVMRKARAVIVCGVPFGPGNLANMELARQAKDSGCAVYVMDGIEDRDYTPGKEAVGIADQLKESGAKSWSTVAELMEALENEL